MTSTSLQHGVLYHIYNRGIDGENLFREARNYRFFLNRYAHYVEPVAQTFAYCLLRNHFHLLVRIRTEEEQHAFHAAQSRADLSTPCDPSRALANLFISYAKAINKGYGRRGNLFCRPFRRIPVTSPAYFVQLVAYIHRNAERHGFVDDYRDWPYSSYGTELATGATRLQRDAVLKRFGGRASYVDFHEQNPQEPAHGLRLES